MPIALNYLAVLVTAVVIFMLGGLWYSPLLFAKPWVALQGKSMDGMKASGQGASPVMYVQVFLCGLVTASVIALIENHFVNLTLARGAAIGVLCWLIAGVILAAWR